MQKQFYPLLLLWFFGGLIAYFFAYSPTSQFLINGDFLPYGADSFYHATRILHFLNHGELLQFDSRLNAPYGDLISWPWGYDSLLTLIIWTITHIQSKYDANYILINIPPFLVWVNLAVIIAIARTVNLSFLYTILVVICFALSPLTQELHLLGRVDHHMVEYTFVLCSLLFGMRWFLLPENKTAAITFGIVLGLAPAFHNGLFILQLPVVITFLILWFYKIPLPKHTYNFLITLISCTLITLIPSQAFQQGHFSYYYHSWFHLYIASATSAILLFLSRTKINKPKLLVLTCLMTLLTLPLLSEVFSGVKFIGGDTSLFENIDEMASPLSFISGSQYDFLYTIRSYSALFSLLPLGMIILLVWYLSDKAQYKMYFLVSSVFGTMLMLSQFRLNYFGSYTLYFPLLIGAMMLSEGSYQYKRIAALFTTIVIIISYLPTTGRLIEMRPLGGSFDYALISSVYDNLAKSCEKEPGIVLADFNDGHYITYHTNCSVISDSMNISQLDFERVAETQRLFSLTSNEIINNEPWVDYIFVRREDNINLNNKQEEILFANKGLRAELLFNDAIPQGLTLVSDVYFENAGNLTSPLAKIYKINR